MDEFKDLNSNQETSVEVISDKEPEKFDWKKEVLDWVKSIAIALVVAFLLKNYVMTLAKVDGKSMEPTLQHADRLYVNKVAYTPKKGDIVIFEPESDPGRPYIKRVIAVEGDTVFIDFETGDVYVNDELLDEPYIKEPTALIGTYIGLKILGGDYSRENPIVIEEDHFFAMGDNRNNSKDSREIGQIPVDELVGHAVFRFWPPSAIGSLTSVTE